MDQGRSSAMAILVIAVVLAISHLANAKDYNVGGTLNWDYPPGTDTTYYDTWSSQQKFSVGDNLVFIYDKDFHDTQVVSESEYTNCAMSSGKTYKTGKDTIPLTKPGNYFFVCSILGHCDMGMKMKVVVSAGSVPPAAPPTTSSLPPATPPTASSPPPVATSPPPATPPPVASPPVTPPATPPVSTTVPTPSPLASTPTPSTVAPVPAPATVPTPSNVPSTSPTPDSSTPEPVSAPAPTQSSAESIRACSISVGAAAVVAIGALLF